MIRSVAHRLAGDRPDLPVEGRLPSFDGATGWLNSEPLTPEDLRGRVVARRLLDLHLRQLAPNAAVHPGLGREVRGSRPDRHRRPHAGVRLRARRRQRARPGRATSGSSTQSRSTTTTGSGPPFANHFWPAVYIADAEGRIRYHHFGEGEYAMTEMVIQQLLIEAGADGVDQDLVSVDPRGPRGRRRLADAALVRRRTSGYGQSVRLRLRRTSPRSTSRTRYELPPAAAQPLGALRDLDGCPPRRGCRTTPAGGSRSGSTRAT